VQARDLVVVGERDVAGGVAADGDPPTRRQRVDHLRVVGAAVEQEWRTHALGFELRFEFEWRARVHSNAAIPGYRKSIPAVAQVEPRGVWGKGRFDGTVIPMFTVRPTTIIASALTAGFLFTGCGIVKDEPAVKKPAGEQPATPKFMASQVTGFFEDVTGDPLDFDTTARIDTITLDRTDYKRSGAMRERYGSFLIFVLHDQRSTAMYKTDGGVPIKPDARGIYWHDDGGTYQAMKAYDNVVLSWIADERQTDERFDRLDGVLSKLGQPADKVRASLPQEDQPCGEQPTGTCRDDATGATVTTVNSGETLELPNMNVKVTKAKTGRLVWRNRTYGRTVYRAKGRYVAVAMRIENTGNEAIRTLYDARLKIGEKIYDQSSMATYTLTPDDAFPLQPGDSTTAALVFDVPVDTAREALQSGFLAFPADDDFRTVEDAARLGLIRLAESDGAASAPADGRNA
jgi:Domain of unknown function (DUF4352)